MADEPDAPVFYDPEEHRWVLARAVFFWLGLVFLFVMGLWALNLSLQPILPALGLAREGAALPLADNPQPAPRPGPPPALAPQDLKKLKQILDAEKARGRKSPKPAPRRAPPSAPTAFAAFHVSWDPASRASLASHAEALDLLFPEWLQVGGAGETKETDPGARAELTRWLKENLADLKVFPLVNNYDGQVWQGRALGAWLGSAANRGKLSAALAGFADRVSAAGLCLDFEDLPPPALKNALAFFEELAATLKAAGRQLAVCAPLQGVEFPYRRLAQVADWTVLLAYDEHWSGAAPGPIASQDWFEQSLRLRQRDVIPGKTLLALGNYAYDWPAQGPAEARDFLQAMLKGSAKGVPVALDPGTLNTAFRYRDEQGAERQVWLLDGVSAFNQMACARKLGFHSFALWRLGGEDPSLWELFGAARPEGADAAERLKAIAFPPQIRVEGRGDVLALAARPTMGRRELAYDSATGRIVSARYLACPTPYLVRRYGAAPKKIVLTFDDGPSDEYTPQILDILKREHAPAVFFIVGRLGEERPALLRRILDEGHLLGNHTYTHPDISRVSPFQFDLELSSTQRLIEGVTGRDTLLFRPPYGRDTNPASLEELRPIERAGALGYLTVGMSIDPSDWLGLPAPLLIETACAQADAGEGGILLLHDGGGNRSETVKALAPLIAELRGRGYEFVPLETLLGKTRDELMPPLAESQGAAAALNRLVFGLFGQAAVLLRTLFLLGIALGVARLLFIGALAALQYRRRARLIFRADYAPAVAVIVPGYNEEKVIVQTIASLLASDYPRALEIVVVDDGSKDATYERARAAFAGDARVRVFKKPNGGKPAALNFGIARTQAEIVVCLDADTVFRKDAVAKLVRHFRAPGVAAVAGNAKVGNRLNLITRWQALEYITSQNLDRRAFSVLNCITVVPGAVGAWRRAPLVEAGGFTHDTLAEDADLTLALLRRGHRVVYEDDAIALTEAPDTFRGFVRQRYRWMYGTLQAAWKHRAALLNPRCGALGLVALPNILIFQVLFPLISPVLDLLLVWEIFQACLERYFHPGVSWGPLLGIALYYLLFQGLDLIAAALAFAMEPSESKGLLWLLPLQRFCYRQLMYYVAIKSVVSALRGGRVGWGTLERKATVKPVA